MSIKVHLLTILFITIIIADNWNYSADIAELKTIIEKVDSKEVDFTQKDLEHMDMFRALIEEENARVSEKYQNAVKNKESDAASAKVINEMEDDPEMVLAS